ncbi:unnamed protein product [marine sediment metagenome]|uniref:Uncharacterized protein n=1 Tax=marine sediment metagenome TaxID=412755 RepID=X1M145_9ZZZZ
MTNIDSKEPKENSKEKKRRYLYKFLPSALFRIEENYLYTVEGFMDFWQHLSDGGKLGITRWLKFPPREIVRLCSISLEALSRMGIEKPENHLAIIRSWGTSTLILSKKK